jgi:hypothetical protein
MGTDVNTLLQWEREYTSAPSGLHLGRCVNTPQPLAPLPAETHTYRMVIDGRCQHIIMRKQYVSREYAWLLTGLMLQKAI